MLAQRYKKKIWCGFKSRRGKNKHLTALKSNSNTVWFNFQTYIYIYIYIYKKLSSHADKSEVEDGSKGCPILFCQNL